MWSAIASLFLGIVGWFATSFFAKPFLDFLTLRGLVFEEMIFTANVDQIVEGTPAYWTAVENAASPWREGTGNRCRSITTVAVVPFQKGI
jgi:hypothetical protein